MTEKITDVNNLNRKINLKDFHDKLKITKIILYKANLSYKTPIKISLGKMEKVENVFLKIETNHDLYGWGEASPYPLITGETAESNIAIGHYIGKYLLGKNPLSIDKRQQEIEQMIAGQPSIKSAYNMALWDILGKFCNLPVFKLLGGENRPLMSDYTVGIKDKVKDTVNDVKKALDMNYSEIKIKTGRPGRADIPHLTAVREICGENISIKIDCNQGWDVATTIQNAQVLKKINIDLIEQPIPAWDFDGFVQIRNQISIPICADETVFNQYDAMKICKINGTDYINIKLGKAGGISTGKKINTIAKAHGIHCMCGCFTETKLGLTASAHLIVACPNIKKPDLDSSLFLNENPIIGGIKFDQKSGGLIHLNDNPGLGVDLKPEYLEKWNKQIIE